MTTPLNPKDFHREAYREEAFELLGELEESLLKLEEDSGNIEIISRVFRALHTIKGSGAMFGFDEIAAFTHDIENTYELIRNGEREATKDLISLTLEAKDHIHHLLDLQPGEVADEERGEGILARLRAMTEAGKPALEASDACKTPSADDARLAAPLRESATYRISFRPRQELFTAGLNPVNILEDITAMGPHYVAAHISGIPSLQNIDPEACYTHWDIILTTDAGINALRDAFIFVEDLSDIRIDVIDEGGLLTPETDYKKLGEILVERGRVTREELEAVIGKQKRLGEVLVERGLVELRDVDSALGEQRHVKEIRRERSVREAAASIRVASEKLDSLVNLVGEMVTVQARLTQVAAQRRDPLLTGIAEEVERLSSELHDNTMSIRMVPIGTTFTKLKRLVRDLSAELGRDVALEVSGGETELDKSVIEKLGDPLVHIIRNCIDHGIETPGLREDVGKPRQGLVRLQASHSGADVVIRISDDGAGLDEKAIREKAVSRGLMAPDVELSHHDILNLVFAPGFSTARRVTDVSGRGVGMDVVRRNIESLRGAIDLESSRGLGTTITLRIPLTLAIIEGLLVRIGPDFFVMPLSAVEECVELTGKERDESHGRDLVNVRGEMVPYIQLRERFNINSHPPEREQIAIAMVNGLRVGFVVDTVIGEHQTVIKSLSRVYRHVRGVSGATILGDGTVALILDIPKLVEDAELDERQSLLQREGA